jgi:hypothetical protein
MKGRKIHLHNLPLYEKNADALEGKRIEFVMKEEIDKPSVDQHAYYRGAVIETGLTAECFGGWTGDDLHEFFANEFLGANVMVHVVRKDGSVINKMNRNVSSLSDLNKKEMSEYVEKCIAFLALEGITVYDSNQYKLNKYKTITRNDQPQF